MTEVQFAKQFLTTLDSKNTKYQSDHVFDPKTFQMRVPYTLPKLSHPPHPLPPKATPAAAPPPGSLPASEPQAQSSAAQPQTINLTLKSNRNPSFTLHLPSLPPTTPISTLKSQVQTLLSGTVSTEKIKILHNKKPIPPSKATVHDVVSGSGGSSGTTPTEAEFGVMIMGGAADPIPNVQTVTLNNEIETSVPGSENAAVETAPAVNPEDVMKGVEVQEVDQKLQKEQEKQQQSEPVQPGESNGKEVLQTKDFWDDLQGFLEVRLKDTEEAGRLRALFEKAI